MAKRWILVLLGAAALALPAGAQESPEAYRRAFARAEQAKRAHDYAGMEAGLREALRHGPGDEHAWRSLAWAQMHQGKWRESLENAHENIRRNGETAWSLSQLYESAMAAGDLELARQALDRADRLPPERRNRDLAGEREQLQAAMAARTYTLVWFGDPKQGGPEAKPVRLLVPETAGARQTVDLTVEGAASWRLVHEGERDLLEVVQRPGQPIRIQGTLTLRPMVVGPRRLAEVPPGPCPEGLRGYLGPFRNRIPYDPAFPAAAEIARGLVGRTGADTVQNVLDWLRANLKYEEGHPDDLGAILKSGRGVCHHYSNLMVTLCRAAGVPAVVAHGVKIPLSGSFTQHRGSHGWVEVYLNGLGWVPVEPLNPNSLRHFGGAGYLFFDTSGHTPGDDHFRYTSLQGWPVDGKLLAAKALSATWPPCPVITPRIQGNHEAES